MRKILLSPHMTHPAIGNLAELRYVRVRLHPDYLFAVLLRWL